MNVKHPTPVTNIEAAIRIYSEKDGVPIQYVMTTEKAGSQVYDIFYRSDGSAHPEFGNRYFGITQSGGLGFIGNADWIEDQDITLGKYGDSWVYSHHVHDFVSVDDGAIDGGRQYTRIVGDPETKVVRVKDGEFVEV